MSAVSGSGVGSGLLAFFHALTPQAQTDAGKEADSAAAKLKARQSGQPTPSDASGQDAADGSQGTNPLDTIQTSPAAEAILSTLPVLGGQTNEAKKDQDAKDLKAAEQRLHFLELLGSSLPPEKLAKEVTDLAKQISGIAADYATNSGGSASSALASPVSNDATTAANAAKTAAAGGAESAPSNAAATANTNAATSAASDTAGQNATTASDAAQTGANSATGGEAGAATQAGTAAALPNAASSTITDDSKASAGGFFGQVFNDLKRLKKLETGALSRLSASTDPKKKTEARKLGSEFNDAVTSAGQSASAAGVSGLGFSQLSLNLAAVTFSVTA